MQFMPPMFDSKKVQKHLNTQQNNVQVRIKDLAKPKHMLKNRGKKPNFHVVSQI